jgi:hypothetical protein
METLIFWRLALTIQDIYYAFLFTVKNIAVFASRERITID